MVTAGGPRRDLARHAPVVPVALAAALAAQLDPAAADAPAAVASVASVAGVASAAGRFLLAAR